MFELNMLDWMTVPNIGLIIVTMILSSLLFFMLITKLRKFIPESIFDSFRDYSMMVFVIIMAFVLIWFPFGGTDNDEIISKNFNITKEYSKLVFQRVDEPTYNNWFISLRYEIRFKIDNVEYDSIVLEEYKHKIKISKKEYPKLWIKIKQALRNKPQQE